MVVEQEASVLVSKGQVISVDLIDGGSGYTEEPKVVVARGFDILNERDIGVSLINIGINSFGSQGGYVAYSTINISGNQIPTVDSFTSIVFDSPISTDRVITAQIQIRSIPGNNLKVSKTQISSQTSTQFDAVKAFNTAYKATQAINIISGRVADIVSTSVLATTRQITTSFENLIPNDALSNINYYANASILQVDLGLTDKVVYVADTSKFKSYGYLLIGDEIVLYYRKLSDRFISVERGQYGTTAKT